MGSEGSALPRSPWPFPLTGERSIRLVLEPDGGIARLVLDAPPRNEMDQEFFRTLAALVGTLKDLSVRGLVIHGAGRHFSSGADISALQAGLAGAQPALAAHALLAATSSFQAIAQLPYPTVAAVEPMLIILPHLREIMPGSNSLVIRNAPLRFVSMILSQRSSE